MVGDMVEIKKLSEELVLNFETFKKNNEEVLKAKAEGKTVSELEQKASKIEDTISKVEQKIEQLQTAINRKNQENGEGSEESKKKEAKAKYREHFVKALQNGERVMSDAAIKLAQEAYGTKSLRVESNPDGGFFVTPDMSARIVELLFETSPMRQVATVVTTGKSSISSKYDGEEPEAWWVGETQERPESGTPQVGICTIPIHELAAQPDTTQVNLDDSEMDIETWLANKLASRFSRMENTAFITGDGVAKPRGILTYPATPGSDPFRDYKRGTIVQIETAASGAISFDDIFDLETALKGDYLNNARFILNRVTLGKIRKLKDIDGQYLWQPSQELGKPATIHEYAYTLMEDMPDVATGALPIGFGDIAETYTIADRMGIRILSDPYTKKGFVLFYTTKRVGGGALNTDSIKLLRVQ